MFSPDRAKESATQSRSSWFRRFSKSISTSSQTLKKRKVVVPQSLHEDIDRMFIDNLNVNKNINKKKSVMISETPTIISEISLTCYWDGDIKEIYVSPNVSVGDLLAAISREYNSSICIGELKFEDEDQDLITISKTSDIQVCLSQDRRKIYIVKNKQHSSVARSNSVSGGEHMRSSPQPVDVDNQCSQEKAEERAKILLSMPHRKFGPTGDFDPNRLLTQSNEPTAGGGSIPIPMVISPLDLTIPEDIKPLGRGNFGEVRVGFLNGNKVACKILFGKQVKNKTEEDLYRREVSILSELRHPNIITYLGTCEEQNRKMIIMEYMDCCLQDYIFSGAGCFGDFLSIIRDVAVGMQFLHENSFLHRDFNSKNVLLNKNLVAKVADFGLSKKKLENTNLSYAMGQIPWMGPEVLRSSKNFTQKSDVYSFGILLWEMVARHSVRPPGITYVTLAHKVLKEEWRPEIPDGVPIEWVRLIESCWAQNSSSRPSFSDIVKCAIPFLASHLPLDKSPPSTAIQRERQMIRRAQTLLMLPTTSAKEVDAIPTGPSTSRHSLNLTQEDTDILDLAKRYEDVDPY